jgi:hypothetical protein
MWDPFERTTRIVEAVESAPSIFSMRPCFLRAVAADRIEMRLRDDDGLDPAALGGRQQGAVARDGEGPRDDGTGPDDDSRKGTRAVPGSLLRPDPLIREEMISCGAALYNLGLAIRVAGHDLAMWLLPDVRDDPALIASVEIVTARVHPPTRGDQELYQAIWLRHTSREPYRILRVPMPILVEMEVAAAREDGWLRMVHHFQARQLLREAARASEVLAGTRPLPLRSGDGSKRPTAEDLRLAAQALQAAGKWQEAGVREWEAEAVGRLLRFQEKRDQAMKTFGRFPDVYGPPPDNLPKTREDFWTGPPQRFERWWWGTQLMALSTDDDRPLDWLRAGRALQHAVLTATRYSMSAPYGRTARYHAPKRYGLPTRSFRTASPRTEARYGVAVSPLTQLLELQDILGEARQWPRRWYHRWPWWYYPEVPQMVLRVGFVPVEQHLAPPLPATEFQDDRPRRRDGERPGR